MGKMLIDKLLRSCPDIENIYMLVRPKKGRDIHTRLEEIFDDQVFCKLRETVPKFRHKIVAIYGDCSLAGLGLKIIDRQTLMSNVHVVFHAAATVRFDEKLRLAVNINVHGTRELIELCSHMQQLQVCMSWAIGPIWCGIWYQNNENRTQHISHIHVGRQYGESTQDSQLHTAPLTCLPFSMHIFCAV